MFTTIFGLICGTAVIVLSILMNNSSGMVFLNIPAAMITVGGTVSASMIYFSAYAMKNAFHSFFEVFKYKRSNMVKTIENIVAISKEAHYTEIMDILHSDLVMEDPFLKKGLTLVADAVEPIEIKRILVRYSNSITAQKRIAERVFAVSGSFAPMFGMTGTVIGLISMLSKISDPAAIPAAMGLALITTLYGLIISALFLIPISGQIRDINHQESRVRQIIIEGVLSIQKNENSQILNERLNGFIIDWKIEKELSK